MMDGTNVPEQDPGLQEKAAEHVEKVKKVVNEKVTPVVEQAQAKASNWTADDQQKFNNLLQIITTVAVVGILLNNRRSFKFAKKTVKAMDDNMVGAQQAIHALKEAGQKFTFYPGVGIYID